jgi:hypothetical protein
MCGKKKVFLFNCIVKFTVEVMQATHHYRIREGKGTQQIYNIFIIIFACAILMNTHLYLFDCARRTNLEQEWCLIEKERKRKNANWIRSINFYFLSLSLTSIGVQ